MPNYHIILMYVNFMLQHLAVQLLFLNFGESQVCHLANLVTCHLLVKSVESVTKVQSHSQQYWDSVRCSTSCRQLLPLDTDIMETKSMNHPKLQGSCSKFPSCKYPSTLPHSVIIMSIIHFPSFVSPILRLLLHLVPTRC